MDTTEKEKFAEATKKGFDDYLAGKEFTLEELSKFCTESLLIEHEKDPKKQQYFKAFLESEGIFSQIKKRTKDEQEARQYLKSLYRQLPNAHVKKWPDFTDSVITYDETKNYTCKIFNRQFIVGSISYIGARPGRGKTTMLVNIALDALWQNKPVVFVTAEETTKQIISRFILAEACKEHEADKRVTGDDFKPRTALFHYIKNKAEALPDIPVENDDLFKNSCALIEEAITSRKLVIFEAYGATWGELTDFLCNREAGGIILIDYIQHLKCPEALVTQTRQIQIQDISNQLANIAGLHNLIMISGAQFNRAAKGNGSATPDMLKADSFDETSFREAGDIEQDGHILIGIGKDPEENTLFYSCMKDREHSPDNGKCWKLKKNLAYSFLQSEKDDTGNLIQFKTDNNARRSKRNATKTTGKTIRARQAILTKGGFNTKTYTETPPEWI